jgi:hypothetical protein
VSLRSKNDCGKSKVTGWNYSIRKEIMIEAKRRKPMNATNITYIAVFTLNYVNCHSNIGAKR